MLDTRPRASAEVVEGYTETAQLAERRRDWVWAWDPVEAAVWGRVAAYCSDMAAACALDDDQYKFQRDKERHRREIPMTADDMDRGLFTIGGAEDSRLPQWKRDIMEDVLGLALCHLAPMQRVCFELVVGGMLSAGEVGEALGCDPREVRNHVARARKRIKTEITPRVQRIAVHLLRHDHD